MSRKNIFFQIKIWQCAAKIIPLTFLAFLFLSYMLEEEIYREILVYGGTLFFAIAVFWWWWVMDKVNVFAQTLNTAAEKLLNIADEIKSVKDEVRNDLDDRKRRK